MTFFTQTQKKVIWFSPKEILFIENEKTFWLPLPINIKKNNKMHSVNDQRLKHIIKYIEKKIIKL